MCTDEVGEVRQPSRHGLRRACQGSTGSLGPRVNVSVVASFLHVPSPTPWAGTVAEDVLPLLFCPLCHSPQGNILAIVFTHSVKFRFSVTTPSFQGMRSSWRSWLIISSVSHPYKFISRDNAVSSPPHKGHGTFFASIFTHTKFT